ncbi:DinB family protein [Glycomyces sp. L485]|nr:DinB family protein [Glycomyces sp. L485]
MVPRIERHAAGHEIDHVTEHPQASRCGLRRIYLHMIEEYARHNGHADLIRERIGGRTGEQSQVPDNVRA